VNVDSAPWCRAAGVTDSESGGRPVGRAPHSTWTKVLADAMSAATVHDRLRTDGVRVGW